MKPVFALLWMILPFSLQQFVYYPEYYYPQPPVIYYDPYAPPCCPACPLFRITYKCKQHKPTEKSSTTIPQATIQTLPHLDLETTIAQTMEHSTQELPSTNAPETTSVRRSTIIDGREISKTVALPSTITEIRTLETSTNPETTLRTDTSTTAETETSTIPREMTTEGASETVTLTSTVTEMRTLESETLMTTEVAETSTTVETSTIAREVTTEEVPGAVTTLETSTNSAATSTIAREMAVEEVAEAGTNSVTTTEAEITTGEAEVTASQKVAETIEFSSIGWILVSERGEDATQFKFGEETTSEYPSTEPTTFGIVVETSSTEELFQNSGISETEITMSSSPVLQYISTKSEELSTVIELGDNLMHTTVENKETTMTEDVPTEIKLLPLRLSIAPQKESVVTTEITAESQKNFPSEAATHTATEVPFTTKPPRRKRTRKPKRTTTTSAPTIAVSTTTKTPVAFFPYVDAV